MEVKALRPPSLENASVRNVRLLTPYVTDNMEIEVAVALPEASPRKVSLEAEGLSLRATVARGADRVIFKFRPPRAEIRGVVRIAGGDKWPADDLRPFAVRWLEPRRIALVDGGTGGTPYEGQAYLVPKP